MKYFIVTTRANLGSTKVVYPANYKELLSVSLEQGMFYFTDEVDGKWKRLHIVPDEHYQKAKKYVDSSNYVVEITEQEAFDLSEKYQGGEVIEDEAKIRRIEIKSRLGEPLTAEEQKALDPDDTSVEGFGRKKTLKDNIAKFKEFVGEE